VFCISGSTLEFLPTPFALFSVPSFGISTTISCSHISHIHFIFHSHFSGISLLFSTFIFCILPGTSTILHFLHSGRLFPALFHAFVHHSLLIFVPPAHSCFSILHISWASIAFLSSCCPFISISFTTAYLPFSPQISFRFLPPYKFWNLPTVADGHFPTWKAFFQISFVHFLLHLDRVHLHHSHLEFLFRYLHLFIRAFHWRNFSGRFSSPDA